MIFSCLFLVFFTKYWQVSASDYERFEENGKIGFKDNNGSIVLPASFVIASVGHFDLDLMTAALPVGVTDVAVAVLKRAGRASLPLD